MLGLVPWTWTADYVYVCAHGLVVSTRLVRWEEIESWQWFRGSPSLVLALRHGRAVTLLRMKDTEKSNVQHVIDAKLPMPESANASYHRN